MKNKLLFCALGAFIFLAIITLPFLALAQSSVKLTVPYIKEVPAGTSGGPWKNACEEASFAMLEQYYTGKKVINLDTAKAFMTMLFAKENSLYGSNVNSDTTQSKYLINTYTDYNAVIVDNPTLAQIKSELAAGRPVITPHRGSDLHNPNIPFLRTGSFYHMMVVIGYDEAARQFITNDPGDTSTGQNHRYDYDVFMNSIHDYSYATKKANGPARAIFTFPKLVRPSGSGKIYYLHDNIRQYVTNPTAFNNHHWNWQAVNTVSVAWFNTFKEGAPISK
ncbi:MAG TPA: C39 family peptidase [Candidatus Methylomirabilis sp.]|nr:C39 family peptidase [Candidatus Methylomirabilis sp.]